MNRFRIPTEWQVVMIAALLIAGIGWLLGNTTILYVSLGVFWVFELIGALTRRRNDTLTEWVTRLPWAVVGGISTVFALGGFALIWLATESSGLPAYTAGTTGAAAIWAATHFIAYKLRKN